jgi:hypothetical protein
VARHALRQFPRIPLADRSTVQLLVARQLDISYGEDKTSPRKWIPRQSRREKEEIMVSPEKKTLAEQIAEIDDKLKELDAKWEHLDREGSQAGTQQIITRQMEQLSRERKALEKRLAPRPKPTLPQSDRRD